MGVHISIATMHAILQLDYDLHFDIKFCEASVLKCFFQNNLLVTNHYPCKGFLFMISPQAPSN